MAEIQAEAYEFDPIAHLDWPTLVAVRDRSLEAPTPGLADEVLLAALAIDATDGDLDRAALVASSVAERVGLDAATTADVVALAARPAGLRAHGRAASRPSIAARDADLADRVGSPDRIRALEVLSRAEHRGDVELGQRLAQLAERLRAVLHRG